MFEEYLEETRYIDFSNEEIKKLADSLKNESKEEIELIEKTYQYVRDVIKHSWDVQDKRVTVSASDVLREGVGICWAKEIKKTEHYSPRHYKRLECWTAFKNSTFAKEFNQRKPSTDHWMDISIGTSVEKSL